MNTDKTTMSKAHHGHNVKRIRDILGIKQEVIAYELNMTQQAFSKLEQKEVIEDELLEKIANVVKVPVDALKNMSEDSTINYFNTFNNNENEHFFSQHCQYTFNPVEKIVELYERLVKSEQEKVALLQKQQNEKH